MNHLLVNVFLCMIVLVENSLLTAIENFQFNIKFETSYVSLVQVVAVQPEVHES